MLNKLCLLITLHFFFNLLRTLLKSLNGRTKYSNQNPTTFPRVSNYLRKLSNLFAFKWVKPSSSKSIGLGDSFACWVENYPIFGHCFISMINFYKSSGILLFRFFIRSIRMPHILKNFLNLWISLSVVCWSEFKTLSACS